MSAQVVEQIVRPTGLMDPEVIVKPTKGQIDDLIEQVNKRVAQGDRVSITTLTKKMAEDLTEYLLEQGLRVRYLHSNIDTIQRIETLRGLRLGEFDALVGINLFREGLDLPEVSLVAILDADKEGFLRQARHRSSRRWVVPTAQRRRRSDHVRRQGHRVDTRGNRGDPAPASEATDPVQHRERHQPADDPQGSGRHPLAAAARQHSRRRFPAEEIVAVSESATRSSAS